MQRTVETLIAGEPVTEGAGVRLRRVFGHHEAPMFDPFLLLDDFRSDTPEDYLKGFPWHPHRGIETITYVLKGDVEHGDSLGNSGVISDGDVQWMTAGSGIIHQEMPKGNSSGQMHGFQLWTNLPASYKMMRPRYQGFTASRIPETSTPEGCLIKVIAGTVAGTTGPVSDIVTSPVYIDCMVPQGALFRHTTPADHTALIYGIEGKGRIGETDIANRQLAHLSEGTEIVVEASETRFRFLLVTGKPIGEPVAWQGPIVMNTQEELDRAFTEYRSGTFVKV
ncbi:pirin family protein [Desulfoluna limicola]|uniref:Pirin family protein n=1 Tax=Desulfoluna limicola TaxID=2810562 RepID=A0ABM7PB70_9BACT|nr:pirin family protein [Desulfoluna limicola]BCS94432.1 pirin family protein [Desulfoluna limicola]